jgi:hypothetical protein
LGIALIADGKKRGEFQLLDIGGHLFEGDGFSGQAVIGTVDNAHTTLANDLAELITRIDNLWQHEHISP